MKIQKKAKRLVALALAVVMAVAIIVPCVIFLRPQSVLLLSKQKYQYTTEEFKIEEQQTSLYSVVYQPKSEQPVPIVIMCHGLNSSADFWAKTAKSFAQSGIACLCFDFGGGNTKNRSAGDTQDMSVLTESEDLKKVINKALSLSFVDKDNIFVMGESLGGLVAAITVADYNDVLKAVILYYPALSIPEMVREKYSSVDQIPQTAKISRITLGNKFGVDVYQMDAYQAVEGFDKPILVLHGTADRTINVSASQKLATMYDNCLLIEYKNEKHCFTPAGRERACRDSYNFITIMSMTA